MRNLKLGVVACGLLGVVGCFLPLTESVSFFGTRAFDAWNVYITLAGFALAAAMGALGVAKRMEPWMAIIALVGFAMIVLRVRGDLVDLLRGGIGAKLMGIGAIGGLLFAIGASLKPEPPR